jgi:hypothetical protein
MLFYVISTLLWYPLRFQHKNNIIGSSLFPVVCRRANVLLSFLGMLVSSDVQQFVLSHVYDRSSLLWFPLRFRITRCSFRLYLQLGVGGLMSWCTTPIDYMSNMAGLLWATGAACSSQVSPQIFGGSELLVFFGFICYVFCSVCHRPVFFAPNVANFSGGSILIAPSVFSGIYSYIWHQSQYIDRCKFIQK